MPKELQIIYNKLNYLAEKSKVHADNLARSSVPGAKANGIEPFKVSVAKSAGTMDQTHGMHIAPKGAAKGHKIYQVKADQSSNSGNGISPESQLMELNEANTQALGLQKIHKVDVSVIKQVYGVVR